MLILDKVRALNLMIWRSERSAVPEPFTAAAPAPFALEPALERELSFAPPTLEPAHPGARRVAIYEPKAA